MSDFLNFVCADIKSLRIPLPNNCNYTLRFKKNEKSFASLWFRTKGCKYSYQGGCTMCDYFISDDVTEEDMFSFFIDALNELQEEPNLMVLMTSGSFLDPCEVPETVRIRIYEELQRRFSKTVFVLETHASTINDKTIEQCLKYFEPSRLQFEIGIESSNEWIRNYCVNKVFENSYVENVIRELNSKGIMTIVNIVVGIPFLSLKENIEQATESVRWALRCGASKCSLFPVNLKPFTLVYWMQKNDMYNQLSLWALIDILGRIRKPFLSRVDINWYHHFPPMQNPLYKESIIGPYTCDECYNKVIALLDEYFLGDVDRVKIVDELKSIKCDCKDLYNHSLNVSLTSTLSSRVKEAYIKIGIKRYGQQFWSQENTNKFLSIEEGNAK